MLADEANTTLRVPATRAPSSTFSVPMRLTSTSRTGRATARRSSGSPARWKISSGARRAMTSTTCGSRTSSWWKPTRWLRSARASARLASEPVVRSSSTSTSWPSASRRSTSVDPMKPAPPVTTVLTRGSPAGLGPADAVEPLARPDLLAVADDAARDDHRARAHRGPLADDRAVDDRVGPDAGAGQQDRALDAGAGRHPRPPADHRALHAGLLVDPGGGVDAVERWPPQAVDQVGRGLDVLLGRAGVDPVGLVVEGVQRAVGDHAGEHLALDRDLAAVGDAVEHRRLEHVGPGVDAVGRGRAGLRLLDERLDLAGVVDRHDAVARRVGHRVQGDRALGPGGVVEGDEPPDVEVGQNVAVEHQEPLGDARVAGGEQDGPGRVERLGLDGVVQRGAGAPTVGVAPPEPVRAVAERQHDVVDAVVGEVADDMLDHRPVDDRQHLLGPRQRQGSQARAEPADEHDGAHVSPPWSSGVPWWRWDRAA